MAAEQLIDAGQHYYILATEVPVAERTLVLKQDETFGVFNDFGDVDAEARYEEGVYHAGTRFLSRLTLTMSSHRLLLLSSTVRRDNVLMTVDLTNPDLYVAGNLLLPRGTLHISRSKFIWHDVCYELVRVRNFALASVAINLAVRFAADYVDIFEVRGTRRLGRGHPREPLIGANRVTLGYEGLDRVVRETTIECNPPPDSIDADEMHFRLQLGSRGERTIALAVSCRNGGDQAPEVLSHEQALVRAEARLPASERRECRVETSNQQFNAWLRSSGADLAMMLTQTPQGPYPYAGVPWFDTTFGRDGIITALQTLWLWPDIARGVLAFLAANQATESSSERDAEPGKILHEARRGEMAALNEIPFARYYGSVDSTPLFVLLASAYFQRTGDLQFIGTLWPAVLAALQWMDRYGDIDHDGFVEYHRRSTSGLVAAGLEGFARLGVPCRRPPGGGADRALRGAGLRLRRQARRRADRTGRGRERARGAPHLRCRGPEAQVRRRVLVRRHRHLRARARCEQAAVPRAHLQSGPLPVHRHRDAGTRAPHPRGVRGGDLLLRLGRAHRRRE